LVALYGRLPIENIASLIGRIGHKRKGIETSLVARQNVNI